jgi:hypothetical protein
VNRAAALLALLIAGCAGGERRVSVPERHNVILITIDGTRWQEVFGGADAKMLESKADTRQPEATRAEYWRETLEERRLALMPFFWGTVAKEGQLLGNVDVGSQVLVTNPYKISYPGYHELLNGFASETINSNKKIANPNPTVLEWLHGRPAFRGSVAAYCSWDVFPSILNRERCGFPIDTIEGGDAKSPLLRRLAADIQSPWQGSVYDAFVFHAGMEYLREKKPRVLYFAFGDTDEWAHQGNYDNYLDAIKRTDGWLKELWDTLQSIPEYRGKTSLIVTSDHGRGDLPGEWRNHNSKTHGAAYIWVAAIGPRIPAGVVWSEHEPFMQSQIAATVAALVGEDYRAAVPKAAPALPILP